ncbi:MAG: DinB family protein [Candidatus Dormiibacterota bacterium]
MLPPDGYLSFVDESLDGMLRIVGELGDDLANKAPRLEGANSPYAILFHCLGVMEYWAGRVVSGRTIQRDRAAEFRASGTVAEITSLVERARAQLVADLKGLDPLAAPRVPPEGWDAPAAIGSTQEGVLLHILDELSRHFGQMELTRDLLRSGWAVLREDAAPAP